MGGGGSRHGRGGPGRRLWVGCWGVGVCVCVDGWEEEEEKGGWSGPGCVGVCVVGGVLSVCGVAWVGE